MALIGQWVFVPLAVLLLILAFWEPARRRMLGCKGIQRLEKRLTLSERGYWAAFALILAAGVWVRCYRFTELPLGMNQDGTMAGVEAFCLLSGGTVNMVQAGRRILRRGSSHRCPRCIRIC